MNSLSIVDCCQMLAIDPKTLRQWLAQAQMSPHAHPTDARVKCLTSEQVSVLASLHGRVLQLPSSEMASLEVGLKPEEGISRGPLISPPDADLQQRLVQMESQVATLQAQVTALSLQLFQERASRTEQRLLALEAQLALPGVHALAPLTVGSVPGLSAVPEVHPTEKRARLIPLIECTAKGGYVLISPKEGELHITPDSASWFAWLASLSSFRFVGKSGRFSARRGSSSRSHGSWYARRIIHQHEYCKYIGVNRHVTIARLEHIAATFQNYTS